MFECPERIIQHLPRSSVIWNVFGYDVVLVCCIASCMFLHIKLCYLSVVSRVETSKILKNCISNTVFVGFSCFKYNFRVISLVKSLDLVLIFFKHQSSVTFSWSVWVWAVFGAPLPGCRGPQVSVPCSQAVPEGQSSPESRRLIQTAGRRCAGHSRPEGWTNSSLENTADTRGEISTNALINGQHWSV